MHCKRCGTASDGSTATATTGCPGGGCACRVSREVERDASRKVCADAWAFRLVADRPACCIWSSPSSVPSRRGGPRKEGLSVSLLGRGSLEDEAIAVVVHSSRGTMRCCRASGGRSTIRVAWRVRKRGNPGTMQARYHLGDVLPTG